MRALDREPYFQFFCGEVVFRWRQRLGEEALAALLQESLSVAHRTGAIETRDLERMVVDATVQEKAIAHPTDARLTHRAIEKLVDLAKREGVVLRQSYRRVAKRAAIMDGRYIHAHQFNLARRMMAFLRTRLGRVIRDIRRNIEGDPVREDRFGPLLDLAVWVRHQDRRQRGRKAMRCTPPRPSASARGRRAALTSSAARCLSRRPSPGRRAASSCYTPRRCTATRSTATPSDP